MKTGVGVLDFTKRNGKAVTTCSVLLDPIVGIRKTLSVVAYAEVNRILFWKTTATGVEYTRHGKTFTVYAKKEVIISAGPFGSPMLLFKSGIGPGEMLKKGQVRLKTFPKYPFRIYVSNLT